jgi:hypothetical protein
MGQHHREEGTLMAAFDFPSTPNVGDIFSDPTSGAAYKWNGYSWVGGAGNTMGALVVSDLPPASPADNSLWYESDTGMLFLRYNDGNSSQWVQINALPSGAGYATIPYVNASLPQTNRIINGNMRLDQRNNGAVGTASAVYTADRWKYNGTTAGKGQWQRLAAGANLLALGYTNYLNFSSLTAYTPAAGDVFIFYQVIEADNATDFAWGTANAQPVTLSFWVYVTVPGTYSGVFKNVVPDRTYPFTFSVPQATTWTKISVTVPGDTGGNWTLAGTAAAIFVQFDLGSGATYRSTAGSWQSGNFCGVTGAISAVSTNGAAFNITGVKLEVGSVATPFQMESLTKQAADCQRYFQYISGTIATILANGSFGGTLHAVNYPTTMRTTPAIAFTQVTPAAGFVGTLVAQSATNRNVNIASGSVQTAAAAYVSYTASLDADF